MMSQIVNFLNTDMGKEAFPEIPLKLLNKISKTVNFKITNEVVMDDLGYDRTCINIPSKLLVICNSNRWAQVHKPEVLYILTLHELLGLMKIELGYNLNVSAYPISGKLLGYIQEVQNADFDGGIIRAEYFSTENQSLGIALENKKTEETLRLICLEKVRVDMCENFSIVRKKDENQTPLLKEVEFINRAMLKRIKIRLQELKRKISSTKKMRRYINTALSIVNYENDLSLIGEEVSSKKVDYKQVSSLLLLNLENIKESCFSDKMPEDWCGIKKAE